MSRMTVKGHLVIERDSEGVVTRATSYGTALYYRRAEDGHVWAAFNATKYSVTTSKHQSMLRREMGPELQYAQVVDEAPDGITCEALLQLALATGPGRKLV